MNELLQMYVQFIIYVCVITNEIKVMKQYIESIEICGLI